jgi:voltage-gated potassium channel
MMMVVDKLETAERRVFIGVGLLLFWTVGGAVGFHVIEGWTLWQSFYMTVITLSTVGYGEVLPLSGPGQVFATVLIIVGFATTVYTFTRLGQLVFEGELGALLGKRNMERELARLEAHVIVCGYGRMGTTVVDGLRHSELPFCVIDSSVDKAAELADLGVSFIVGDATEESVLESAGLARAATVLALLPSDADNLYLTVTARDLNADVRVIACAFQPQAEARLRRGGAEKVISPHRIAGHRVLNSALHPTTVELQELWSDTTQNLCMEELLLPVDTPVHGKSIAELGVKQTCGIIIIAVKQPETEMVFNPDPKLALHAGDMVVVIGHDHELRQFETFCRVTG